MLYIPLESLQHSPEVAVRDNELVKRLEGKNQKGASMGSTQFMKKNKLSQDCLAVTPLCVMVCAFQW